MTAIRRYALTAAAITLLYATIFCLGFAATYDWGTYHDVKQQRQARGEDYTLREVLSDTLKDLP